MRPAPTHLVYLHGFRSSPQSAKARQVMAWMARERADVQCFCPQLPPSPRQAMALVEDRLLQWARAWEGGPAGLAARVVVMGSSLGGFYATHLAERFGLRAVLLNPAVDPARDLAAYIGEQRQWHGDERFFFEPHYVDELRALTHPACSAPDRVMAIIATGDEVLDWNEMRDRYRDSQLRIVTGSDHALSDFAEHLGAALDFLGLWPAGAPLTS